MVDVCLAVGTPVHAELLLLILQFEAVAALGAIGGVCQHINEPKLHLRGDLFLGHCGVLLRNIFPGCLTPLGHGRFCLPFHRAFTFFKLFAISGFRLFRTVFGSGFRVDQLLAFRTNTEAHLALNLRQRNLRFTFRTGEPLRHGGRIAARLDQVFQQTFVHCRPGLFRFLLAGGLTLR